ncbi:uncharacterized protein LOC126895556 isoform X2 [Daktulosphaira vitifoliae]|uniref:uncharacterized protein LOC126895556 isoform X2 n=1 Tax=Daktulosphaira vitifoliae TaxID=58002 RepID=UPI0021AAE17A|nr:uncharacterized protein LOC126895556 isoform X2 [Daktulosphaira vitifoliae]
MVSSRGGLTELLAILSIVDLFGVLPIIVLPGQIAKCGWLGIPLAIFVFVVQVFTAILLGKCWVIAETIEPNIVHKNRYPYAAIAGLSFGRTFERIVHVMQNIAVFGAIIPNLLIAADNLYTLGKKVYSENLSFCICLIIIGIILCPPIWLGSPKDLKWISLISVFTVSLVSILTWILMIQIPNNIYVPVPKLSWSAMIIAYSVLAFQFDVHPLILTIQMDMNDIKKVPFVVIGAFFFTCSLFLITVVIGYLKLGGLLNTNLLNMLPKSHALNIVIILIILQICLSTAVSTTPLFQNIENYLHIPKEFTWKRCVLRTFIMILAILIGEVVPRLDLVMSLVGSLLTGPLMFILPPILYLKIQMLYQSKTKHSKKMYYSTFPSIKLSTDIVSRHFISLALIVMIGILASGIKKLLKKKTK